MTMIQVSRLLTACNPQDLAETMLHGTFVNLISAIRNGGLKAGGRSDPDDPRSRAHIHMVASIEGTGELAGVRSTANACIEVYV